MKRAALIPVKRLKWTKSRLGKRLDAVERAGFSIAILSGVVEACRDTGLKPICVSSDPYVESLAKSRGWGFVRDEGRSLRSAVEMGVQRLLRSGFREIMVVSSDLPLIRSDDIAHIVKLSDQSDVVLCPNLNMNGTNIVYLKLPRIFKPLYGRNSYEKHLRFFENRGLVVKTFMTLGTALDIDTPSDLKLLSRLSTSSTPSQS